MKKSLLAICAITLLVLLTALPAIAAAQSNGYTGDQGGVMAKELEERLRSQTGQGNQRSAPASGGSSSGGSGAYQPVAESQPQSEGGTVMYTNPATGETFPVEVEDEAAQGTPPAVAVPPEMPVADPNAPTQALDWFATGYDLINKHKDISIMDVKTGVTWRAKYINGRNHADIIPASADDATLLTKNNITGDYVRRPVVVTINGQKYAGSMYAEGHGDTSYCSYFKGVMCIHFTGSKTHGTQKVDSDHQTAVQEALKY